MGCAAARAGPQAGRPPSPAPVPPHEGEAEELVEACTADDEELANDRAGARALLVTDSSIPGRVQDFYVLEEELGAGSYGTVQRATRRSCGAPRAVKTISKSQAQTVERGIKKIKTEIDVMLLLVVLLASAVEDHPNVVKLYENYEDRWNVYLVLELCRGVSLEALLQRGGALKEAEAAALFGQTLEAVRYLHQQQVCHRDVKPDNLLFYHEEKERLRDNTLKLGDFGLACKFPEAGAPMREKVGSPFYVAPEVLLGRYSAACDLWSCGVLLHVLLAGSPPFYGDDVVEVQRLVWSVAISLEGQPWDSISAEAKTLVRGLLEREVGRRLTAEQALRRPWVAEAHRVGGEAAEAVDVAPSLEAPEGSWWQRCGDPFALCAPHR